MEPASPKPAPPSSPPKTALRSKQRVLLIEDNLGDAQFLRIILSEGAGAQFYLEHAEELASGLARLQRGGVDLVLLDLTLPDSHGPETFTVVHQAAPEIPIIVLSGTDDQDLAIRTVQEGAQDYLVKGQFDNRLLSRSMHYAIERKRAEEALARERDLLHTLLDNIPDRIYFKDDKSRFLRINRAVSAQFKLTEPRQAIGKTDFDFFTNEHAQKAFDDEQSIIRTGQAIIGLIERETLPGGRVTWALTSKMPLRDKAGKIAGTFGISRDITDLKNFENALAAERNLLRSLIDNLPDYIYIKDAESHYVLDNIAHRRFLGASTMEEIIGRTTADFYPPDLAQRYLKDDQDITASGQPLLNRIEPVMDRRGNTRWHSTTKVPLRDPEGRVTGLVCIGRDITEQKESEERLRQANFELARSREELLKVLADLRRSHDELKSAQMQLIQAEKLQSLGRLAAGVAHEVKNPLAILRMGLDYFLQNHSKDPDAAAVLRDMTEAIQRADTIIRGMLDFSLPHDLKMAEEDLNVVVEQSLNMVRHELANSPVKLRREFASGLPTVRIDGQKIIQVLVNVLTNAIQAMAEGGTLTVRTYLKTLTEDETVRDAGSRKAERLRTGETVAVIEVDDTGPGIPEEKLARIFDPFFTTKPAGHGTGLGLTVTKKIVEIHGGTIRIKNRPEGGVQVTILLKVHRGNICQKDAS